MLLYLSLFIWCRSLSQGELIVFSPLDGLKQKTYRMVFRMDQNEESQVDITTVCPAKDTYSGKVNPNAKTIDIAFTFVNTEVYESEFQCLGFEVVVVEPVVGSWWADQVKTSKCSKK